MKVRSSEKTAWPASSISSVKLTSMSRLATTSPSWTWLIQLCGRCGPVRNRLSGPKLPT
ncbi:hypothetical protein [Stutzerimonas kunmingensis]|uniref:hypothetical protein n=1 Tax=Stutzerimonas kunmingensis TaxID=1211807 RepID=UPI0035E434A5